MKLQTNALALALVCGAASMLASTDADAQRRQTAQQERQQKTAEIPVCAEPLGAIAVYLCEAKSDDSLWINGILGEPAAGEELAVVRLLEPLEG